MYRIVLFSDDYEDYVTESTEFSSLSEAVNFLENMGSRWVFYPIPFIFEYTDHRGFICVWTDELYPDLLHLKKSEVIAILQAE